RFALNNKNFYANTSFGKMFDNDWTIFAGGSYTYGNTKVGIDEADIKDVEHSAHLKLKLKKRFSNRFKLNFGAEQFVTDFDENFSESDVAAKLGFNNTISAVFAETDIVFSRKLALKMGVRGEYSWLFK